MNIKFFLILFLPIAITDKVNKIQIAKFRKDFIKQLINGLPFAIPSMTLKKTQIEQPLKDDVVVYYFYDKKHPNASIVINNNQRLVNPNLPVKILIHGWTEHYYADWCKNITAAYLKKGAYNVIVLDWSSKGDADYISASLSVPEVANNIGDFIANRLYRGRKVPLENIHVVSHSLGCHVAGVTGQRVIELTGKKLARITALDPAAPYFDFITLRKDDRLSPDDASFVDIVHTDAGWLGFKASLGKTDFYPNGGTAFQPGCSLLKPDVQYEDLFCSHAKSHRFFLQSIMLEMKAVPCDNWSKFDKGVCDNNTEVYFGDDAPNDITGNYYLRTPEEMSGVNS